MALVFPIDQKSDEHVLFAQYKSISAHIYQLKDHTLKKDVIIYQSHAWSFKKKYLNLLRTISVKQTDYCVFFPDCFCKLFIFNQLLH